jgi:hypothetical protein
MANHQRAFVPFLQENPPILFAAGVLNTGRNFPIQTEARPTNKDNYNVIAAGCYT